MTQSRNGENMRTPRGTFDGSNFMTPHVLSHHRVRGGYAELSRGHGLTHNTLFGVTVRRGGGGRLNPDPSRVFGSLESALTYIAGLS